jgi:hypothetical protein
MLISRRVVTVGDVVMDGWMSYRVLCKIKAVHQAGNSEPHVVVGDIVAYIDAAAYTRVSLVSLCSTLFEN